MGVASPGDKGRRHMACTGGGAGEPASECPASGEVNWIPTRRPARGSGARDHPPPRPRAPGRVATPRRGGTPRLPAGRQLSVPAPGGRDSKRGTAPVLPSHRPRRWLISRRHAVARGRAAEEVPPEPLAPGARACVPATARGVLGRRWPVRVVEE